MTISRADVFIYNGGESEQWVTDILDAAGEDIPCVLSMMDAAELREEELVEGMQGGASAHDHHDHDEDGEEIEYDEHIWTSPVTAMALMAVGFRSLSMAATSIGPVKDMIRSVNLGELEAQLAPAINRPDGPPVRKLLQDFAEARDIPLT